MTGTPFNDDLAGAEVMLRERFEDAVGGLTPDIGRIVADGTADGRGAVRRRRVLSGIAVAAVAVIAVGSVTYASQNDLFGRGDDHATDNGQLIELEPATPRGLVAAVMAHTKEVGTLLAAGGSKLAPPDSAVGLSGQVAYDLGGGAGVEIDVYATTDMSGTSGAACDGTSIDGVAVMVCRTFTLPDGMSAWYVEYGAVADAGNGLPAAMSAVVTARDDQVVAVLQTMSGRTDFVLDQSALAEIAADPAVGLSTTPRLNELGQDIPDFRADGLVTSDSGSSSGSFSSTASPPSQDSMPPDHQPSRGSGDSSSATSN